MTGACALAGAQGLGPCASYQLLCRAESVEPCHPACTFCTHRPVRAPWAPSPTNITNSYGATACMGAALATCAGRTMDGQQRYPGHCASVPRDRKTHLCAMRRKVVASKLPESFRRRGRARDMHVSPTCCRDLSFATRLLSCTICRLRHLLEPGRGAVLAFRGAVNAKRAAQPSRATRILLARRPR